MDIQVANEMYTVVNEDDVLVGSIVDDRYEVLGILGQGTTGTVFAVEHVGFPRPAAMKVLRPRYVTGDVLQQVFYEDARTAWSVVHPCLAEVFDVGSLPDGSPFFVMEKLDGETLATCITRGRLSVAAAVDIMMQLLSAIGAMHVRGLLLRDLRPQNVFLARRDGCRPLVKVLDAGLSRLTPAEQIQSEWDALRTTLGRAPALDEIALPHYLSPERTRGEAAVTEASDIFVAGVLFYEALTGRRPFVASSFDGLMLRISEANPPPIATARLDVPVALAELVTRMLASAPEDRPSSIEALQRGIRGAFDMTRRPSRSPIPPPPPPGPRLGVNARAHAAPPLAQAPRVVPHAYGLAIDVAAATPAGAPLEDDDPTQTERRRQRHAFDEASADNPARTVRPPSLVAAEEETAHDASDEIIVDVEEPASSGDDAASLAATPARSPLEDEDDTETMKFSDDLRARIEALQEDGSRYDEPAAHPDRSTPGQRRNIPRER